MEMAERAAGRGVVSAHERRLDVRPGELDGGVGKVGVEGESPVQGVDGVLAAGERGLRIVGLIGHHGQALVADAQFLVLDVDPEVEGLGEEAAGRVVVRWSPPSPVWTSSSSSSRSRERRRRSCRCRRSGETGGGGRA
jgi:hypothetical protein